MKSHRKISLLYVDDEPDLLDIGKRFLERSGEFIVTTFSSAKDAIKSSKIFTYDAIISDYEMPEMDGISFLKLIRQQSGSIPFILFTGRGREEVVIEAINNGANYYLQKGGDLVSLFAELSHKIHQSVKILESEIQIKESQKTLSDILNFLPDPIIAIDTEGKVIAWNLANENLLGISAENILGTDNFSYAIPPYGCRRPLLLDLINETDEKISQYYTNIRRRGDVICAEAKDIQIQGKKISALITACPLYNTSGERKGAIELIHDISDLKAIEHELRMSEERYRSIVNDQNDNIFRFSVDGTITFVNESCRRFLSDHLHIQDIIGKNIQALFGMLPGIAYPLESLNPQNPVKEIEYQISGHNGEQFCHHISIRAIFDNYGSCTEYMAVGRDITQRKRVEEAVVESENRLRAFIEGCQESVVIIDEDGRIIEWNEKAEYLTGITKNDAIGAFVWDISVQITSQNENGKNRKEHIEHIFRSSLHTGIPPHDIPIIIDIARPDGIRSTIRQISFTMKTRKGYRIGSISQDITQYKKLEEELYRAQERFLQLADHSSDVIALFDKQLNPTYISPSVKAILGYEPEELIGKTEDFASQTIFSSAQNTFLQTIQTLINGETIERTNLELLDKNGTPISVDLYAVPFMKENHFSGAQIIIRHNPCKIS